ncbi:S8 family serine peptidase [Marivirga sp. S37H4]|uniref:S8 family serine peptidase n=1 Tax=Marivirga aurantiaca TaxID=2802615 RepID=A0A934WV49_9BACT|nr:GEVED domain-containing protein [Marivirga aurantiaca]MBK6263588.1 S8 family serine peptidase [Marivirga aurantiaca]
MKRNFTNWKMLMIIFCLPMSISFAQTKQEITKLTKDYNKGKLSTMESQFAGKAIREKQEALDMAQRMGWDVKITMEDGTYAELQKLTADGQPIYYTTYNVDAAKSTRADHLNSGGSLGLSLNGQNMTAYVWDGGLARGTHQEYDGAGGSNRFSIGDGSSTLNFHAAHVTGTIIASGVDADAKGMAPHAKAIGSDWNSDIAEATSAASNGMLLSNHSYGYRSDLVPDWYFGAYIDDSRDWDDLMHNSPYYLMVVAAGNDGSTNYNGSPLGGNSAYDKLTGHATSKNNMVVANANDANIASDGTLNSVSINSSSSEGPTDDLRIKPDITGNGTGVYSTYESSNTAYASITGTSMASPNVTGTLLLLQQHASDVTGSYMKAATLKGLALHTADDAGITGPDAIFGWGLLNAKAAATAITENGNASKIEELSLNSGQSYSVTVESDGTSPLLASISWTDLAGTANTGTTNDNTPVLVNDLDIRVTQGGSTFSPYKLTSVSSNTQGDNNVDPYERIDVNNASGTYTITVTHKGSLSGGSQDFSLIVTGISGDPVACEVSTPNNLNASNVGSSTATLGWDQVSGTSYDVRYKATSSSSWTTVAVSGTSTSLSGLSASTQYEAQVRSKCSDGTTSSYSGSVTFTTTEVQITYCDSNGNSVADEYIGKVAVAGISNTTGASSSGYADYTNLSTDLNQDEAYTITITPEWTGTVYAEGYSVWIDYNKDGDFTDAGEQVWTQSATQNTPVSGSFTVPAGASTGETTMRVSMKYNGIPTSCESFSYGEVEDYTVNITEGTGVVCTVPGSLSASNIGETTATLNWSNESADSYGLRVRASGSSSWSNLTASSNSQAVSGLSADTQYEFQVRSVCGGTTSNYSSSATFTTDAPVQITYCDSEGNNSSYEWIRRVVLGSIDNTSGDNGGYGDFTSQEASVARGGSTSMNVQAGFSGSSYNEYWSVWVDLNQDGVFSSTERLVNGSSSSSNLLSATLNIPSSALLGKTRMRVTMKYNSQGTPCETFAYGEVEDYTVNIVNSTSSMVAMTEDNSSDILGNEANSRGYQLFPNPANDAINFNVKNIDTNEPVRIYTNTGSLVKEIMVKDDYSKIDVSDLAKGMYIIKAKTIKEVVNTNFVIN